jgi:hypothetical protein
MKRSPQVQPNHQQEFTQARRRVGKTPIDQARWLLRLAYLKLRDLSPEQAIDLWWEVRVFSLPLDTAVHADMSAKREDDVQRAQEFVARFQEEILTGLQEAMSGQGWEVRHTAKYRLVLITWEGRRQFQLNWMQTERDRLIHAMRCLELASAENRIGLCARPRCRLPFVPVRRQRFCREVCSRRTRWERFVQKWTPEQLSEKRHQAYVDRVQKKLGKVKPQRRGMRKRKQPHLRA